MFTTLNVFNMARAMAEHAAQRQTVIARNIANADTPGYRARDISSFSEALSENGGFAMRATRTAHLNRAGASGPTWEEFEARSSLEPGRNGVSLEEEMVKAAEVRSEHNRALAIYRSSLAILRSSLGRV